MGVARHLRRAEGAPRALWTSVFAPGAAAPGRPALDSREPAANNPAAWKLPRDYNAAADLIGRNLAAGRGGKLAYIDDAGQYTFAELAERVNRFGSGLQALGLQMEERVLIAMLDGIDWPTAFLGSIKAGIIPIAVNTLLHHERTTSTCSPTAAPRR